MIFFEQQELRKRIFVNRKEESKEAKHVHEYGEHLKDFAVSFRINWFPKPSPLYLSIGGGGRLEISAIGRVTIPPTVPVTLIMNDIVCAASTRLIQARVCFPVDSGHRERNQDNWPELAARLNNCPASGPRFYPPPRPTPDISQRYPIVTPHRLARYPCPRRGREGGWSPSFEWNRSNETRRKEQLAWVESSASISRRMR